MSKSSLIALIATITFLGCSPSTPAAQPEYLVRELRNDAKAVEETLNAVSKEGWKLHSCNPLGPATSLWIFYKE